VSDRGPTGAQALDLLMAERPDLIAGVAAIGCAGHDLAGLCRALSALVPAATGVRGCRVYVLSDDGRSLDLDGGTGSAATAATSGPDRPAPARYPIGQGLPGWVAAHRTASHRRGTAAEDDRLCLPVLHDRGGLVAAVEVHGPGSTPEAAAARVIRLIVGTLTPALWQARQLEQFRDRGASAERFAEWAVAAQETERARLSREIHDGISQRLAGVGFHLSAAGSLLPGEHSTEGVRAQLGQARALVDLASAEMRAAIAALRPPILDDLGLPAALSSLAREARTRAEHVEIELTLVGELPEPLPDHVQTALYRIAQEALTNALTHAAAASIDLVLELETDRVTLTVIDDGRGFRMVPGPVSAGPDGETPRAGRADSYGLRSMHERAELVGGWLSVSSRRGTGTQVRAVVPLPGTGPAGTGPADPANNGARDADGTG
jgi:two-component system, NarL family, sensor kinase